MKQAHRGQETTARDRLHGIPAGRIGATFVLCVAACAPARDNPGKETDKRPPNVLLILADDLGVECLGSYGGTSWSTPRLDALAAEGVRFEEAHAQPLCTPSRVKLLTGLSNAYNHVAFGILRKGERTFAHAFQEAGYRTAIAGKWQLSGRDQDGELAGRGQDPAEAGFDTFRLWQVTQHGSRYADPLLDTDGDLRVHPGAYGPDLFVEFLADFMSAARDEPFLAYYSMALPHRPFEAPPGSPAAEGDRQARFGAMITALDAAVGRLLDRLDELGLAENTLVLFTGDNGTDPAIVSVRDGRGVPGGKGSTLDRGTHVPLLARWTGHTPRGATCPDLIDLGDVFPTLAELCGLTQPDDPRRDGQSFLPQVLGRPGTPRRWITCWSDQRPERGAPIDVFARDRRWKLYRDGRLFDLSADPEETRPVVSSGDEDSEVLAARALLQEALATLPAVSPATGR